ncbi:hypothetical protein [Bradyrhizobium sp. cf659]|uniref:hypothetical protein n=1 Tax=Bradyrhizobium sp. cf659 TaxID=1761771 RepID=UPI0008E19C04|nr:hypothetical protein [Bradyrhizobium sp. cf659]SFJ32515.1 hypothetical protein SAMN04487925_106268 [Bradyrhizobium sp. cf659]
MSFTTELLSPRAPCTTKVYRPLGGIAGPRLVRDAASRVAVCAIPLAQAAHIAALAAGPAAYVLMSHDTAYFGETSNASTRISKHLSDPTKAFARIAYIVTGYPEPWSNKGPAIYLQYHLWEIARTAGFVNIANDRTPQMPVVGEDERGELQWLLEHARQQLFDAGCLALDSNFDSLCRVASPTDLEDDPIGPHDNDPIRIDVVATPPAGSELELNYVGLWARGYPTADGGFVVMPGAEMRTPVNGSAHEIVKTRRDELRNQKALVPIPGIANRERLLVAVWFPSPAIAAKVVTGAHAAARVWVRRRFPQPIIIAK